MDEINANDVLGPFIEQGGSDLLLPRTEGQVQPPVAAATWDILVIDDELLVHKVTEFALEKHTILGRKLSFFHAYSSVEAIDILRRHPNIAVAMIDVVMETNDSGLDLVKRIRDEGFEDIRLILRTGQPGYAPELSVLKEYDINDYRTKNELTSDKLIAVLITAVRSYQQIQLIKKSRKGLRMIIDASTDLFAQNSLERLAEGVLEQIAVLLEGPVNGLVAAGLPAAVSEGVHECTVISGIGAFRDNIGRSPCDFVDDEVIAAFSQSKKCEMYTSEKGTVAMLFPQAGGTTIFVYVESEAHLTTPLLEVLRIFSANIDLAFRNLHLMSILDSKAFTDTDTGIPNQNALIKVIERIIEEGDIGYYLIQLHSDNWESIFGFFGYEMANRMQWYSYQIISGHMQFAEQISLLGNGDLAILIRKNYCDFELLKSYKLITAKLDSTEMSFSTLTTITELRTSDTCAESVMRRSNAAMFWAKRNGESDIVFFQDSFLSTIEQRVTYISRLKRALDGEINPLIEVYLQPKVNMLDSTIVGAEALARWGTEAPPSVFIPLIEESGMSSLLNDLLMRSVADFSRRRRESALRPCPVSINLSMKDIVKGNFASDILRRLTTLGLSPGEIEFEITESSMMADVERTVSELEKIREAGYILAIDDFGIGYSSLNYLVKLPVDILKIDKSFVDTLTPVNARKSVVATIAAIAESRNIKLIAEGIENSGQVLSLLFFGCNVCQGFYYHKPMPIGSFLKLLI